MVAKKRLSKRLTSRDRFKIIKNISETHRKRRKDAKTSKHSKTKKDPGIPNSFPFKEELLQQAVNAKELLLQEKAKAKLAKKENKAGLLNSGVDLETFMQQVAESAPVTTKVTVKNKKHVLATDLINDDSVNLLILVLDARDPLVFQAIQNDFRALIGQKNVVLVLNKIDLCPRIAVEEWINVLGNNFAVVPIKSTNPDEKSIELLIQSIPKDTERIGVVGLPNSGKSTFIKAVRSLNEDLKDVILALPGIFFTETSEPSLNASHILLANFSCSARIPKPIDAFNAIAGRFSKEQLCEIFNIPYFINTNDFLVQYARKNNFIRKHGVPDPVNAARGVIWNWYNEKVNYYSLPPRDDNDKLDTPKKSKAKKVKTPSKQTKAMNVKMQAIQKEILLSLSALEEEENQAKFFKLLGPDLKGLGIMICETLPAGYLEGSQTEDQESSDDEFDQEEDVEEEEEEE